MQKPILPFLLVATLWSVKPAARAQTPDSAILKSAPSISNNDYTCHDLVQAVNRLRHYSKHRIFMLLNERLLKNDNDEKCFLLLRLLFVNPNGWEPLVLGQPVPDVHEELAKQFDGFPITLSQGVPFLLTHGYRSGGAIRHDHSASGCLEICQNLELIGADLPTKGYRSAARALLNDPKFKQLYLRHSDQVQMARIILRQAE